MLTTQNIYREEAPAPKPTIVSTVADRMRKMREAKVAKKAQRMAKAGACVREQGMAPTTTGVAPSNPGSGTPAALSPHTTQQLQTMYDPSSLPGGLCAKALSLLEAQ